VLGLLGLPTTDDTDFDELLAAMRLDKKTRGNQLRFVVLDGLARPAVLAGPDEQLLREAHRALAS
jgi:3-dehydroquinate synthase